MMVTSLHTSLHTPILLSIYSLLFYCFKVFNYVSTLVVTFLCDDVLFNFLQTNNLLFLLFTALFHHGSLAFWTKTCTTVLRTAGKSDNCFILLLIILFFTSRSCERSVPGIYIRSMVQWYPAFAFNR